MKYRMLAIDLDGTLFDSDGRIPAINRQAVERAREAGMIVVLCTGRGLTESRPAIEALDHHGPIVLAGGALVSDPTTRKTLHRAIIEPHLVAELIDYFDPTTHAVLVLLDPEREQDDYLIVGAENLTDNTRWWFNQIGARTRHVMQPTFEDLHHALRVGIVAPSQVMEPISADMNRQFNGRVNLHHFTAVRKGDEDIHVLEVFAAGVDKWSGLTWLAAEHGIELDQIAAIGDHINDVSMVQHAACGIAMANAVDSLRQVAARITESNDAGGVAVAIDHLLTGRW